MLVCQVCCIQSVVTIFIGCVKVASNHLLNHESQGIGISFHHRVSYLHLSLLVPLLLCMVVGISSSTSIPIIMTSSHVGTCIFLILLVHIC